MCLQILKGKGRDLCRDQQKKSTVRVWDTLRKNTTLMFHYDYEWKCCCSIPTLSMIQRGIHLLRFMNSKIVDIMILCKQHNECC